jgi:hypothetical protein
MAARTGFGDTDGFPSFFFFFFLFFFFEQGSTLRIHNYSADIL